ncbi:MAG: integrase arm-type DNA-binding domain-containing protein [Myxococcales bacterium]|nr:integrase arm-type DNA-binding domain-containing protein [Myxococcales bacterium]
MPLTNVAIKSAKPGKKTQKLFDGGGLYLEVTPRGGTWWRLKYRYLGKDKRLSMGVYPDVTLKLARERRDEARKLLANGIDPSAHRKANKSAKFGRAANSFEVVATEWFDKQKPNWAPAHAARVLSRLERYVFPWIGSTPIADVSAPDVLGVIQRIEKDGALETAHRTLGNCSQVIRYAVATGRADRDPCGDLRGALPPTRAKHFSTVTEPEEVAKVLRALDAYTGTLVVHCAIRLAPLVFVRPGELRRAQWQDIDLEEAEWRFEVTKTNSQHIVPLARQSIAILREVEPLTGQGRYVFPSARGPARPMSDNALTVALRSMGIDQKTQTIHGFRATARTILDEVLGFRPDFIEHQLCHAVRDPNGRAYNRTAYLPERRKMMQGWANYLDKLKKGEKVIPINRASAPESR